MFSSLQRAGAALAVVHGLLIVVASPVIAGSVAVAHGPTCPQHVGSAWTRNGTCVP